MTASGSVWNSRTSNGVRRATILRCWRAEHWTGRIITWCRSPPARSPRRRCSRSPRRRVAPARPQHVGGPAEQVTDSSYDQAGAHGYQLDGLEETIGAHLLWKPHIPERTTFKDAADTATPLRALGTVVAAGMADIYSELAARLMKEF